MARTDNKTRPIQVHNCGAKGHKTVHCSKGRGQVRAKKGVCGVDDGEANASGVEAAQELGGLDICTFEDAWKVSTKQTGADISCDLPPSLVGLNTFDPWAMYADPVSGSDRGSWHRKLCGGPGFSQASPEVGAHLGFPVYSADASQGEHRFGVKNAPCSDVCPGSDVCHMCSPASPFRPRSSIASGGVCARPSYLNMESGDALVALPDDSDVDALAMADDEPSSSRGSKRKRPSHSQTGGARRRHSLELPQRFWVCVDSGEQEVLVGLVSQTNVRNMSEVAHHHHRHRRGHGGVADRRPLARLGLDCGRHADCEARPPLVW